MNQSNPTLAKRIAELERQLSSTKNLLESSMLSEATAKQYAEEVNKQNAALAAQVEALKAHIANFPAVSTLEDAVDWERNGKAVIQATPQHHLRQVRADAGRDGFIAGSEQTASYITSEIGYAVPLLEARANQYHASILAGKE